MIFTKNVRTTDTGKEFEVRFQGFNTWLTEADFSKQVTNGQVFYKANYPVTEKDLVKI